VGRDQGARYIFLRHAEVSRGLQMRQMVRHIRRAIWDETRREIPPEHLAYARALRDFVLFNDPPEHARLRQPINRILHGLTTPDFRAWAAAESEALAASLPSTGMVDMVADFATLLTSQMVGQLVGLAEDFPPRELDAAASCIQKVLSNLFEPASMAEASAHVARLEQAIQRRMEAPVPPNGEARLLESILTECRISGLPLHQTRSTAVMLLIAARDNVRSTIGNAVLNLLRHPPAWRELRAEPALIPAAVEEVLRFEPPVHFVFSHAAEEVELGGVRLPAGMGASFCLASANRDPDAFENPDQFDMHRQPGPQAAFGFGIHRCPGTALARILIEEALKAILQRWPEPSLAVVPAALRWKKSMVFRVLESLPVKVG
jgi:cytochrome P450